MLTIVGPTVPENQVLSATSHALYDVTAGSISVDGHDIQLTCLVTGIIVSQFGMVLQDAWLFGRNYQGVSSLW